jgi:hypothetical protein
MLDILLCIHPNTGSGGEPLISLLNDRTPLSPTSVASVAKDAFSLRGLYSDYFRAVACNYSRDIADRVWADRRISR